LWLPTSTPIRYVAHVFHVDQHVPRARFTMGVEPVFQLLGRLRVQFPRERDYSDVAEGSRFSVTFNSLGCKVRAAGYSHRGVKMLVSGV
jgi:hypothetical protein